MDVLSARLMVSLQLVEVEELHANRKGKGVEETMSDAEMALLMYRDELTGQEPIHSDAVLAQSIASAVTQDGPLMTIMRLEEDNAIRDRDLACQLGSVDGPNASADLDEEIISRFAPSKLAEAYTRTQQDGQILNEDGLVDDMPSSSRAGHGNATSTGLRTTQCVACRESKPHFDTMRVPCGHNYCRDCITGLFKASTTDESLFPPRCCSQEVSLISAKPFMTTELINKFQQKAVEFQAANRMYCISPVCSAFVPLDGVKGDIANCSKCQTRMCVICKNRAHHGDCPEDTVLQQVLEVATANGWQRCYNCRRLVELAHGCNHMT
ncbi:MAG: hypothetical protein M1837_001332 [Sclerophora amabilis]|nr:MAG: hypothetical protein M1837_001332 [Sclerophora amabilis]